MSNSAPSRPSLFWPLLLITGGGLLLLQNLGLLPPDILDSLLQLWPVLLILLGLDMLVGRRSGLGRFFVVLVSVLVVAGALAWAALRAQSLPAGATQALIQTVRGAETAEVEIEFGVGELNLSALGPSDFLLEGEAQNGPGERVEQRYTVAGGVGRLNLRQQRAALFAPFLAARQYHTRWDLRLSGGLPLELKVSTDVGHSILDLTGLRLTRLDLRAGVGQTEVVFPAEGGLQAEVTTGLGETILTIPDGLTARITVNSGLTGVNIPARFERQGQVYTTPGFSDDQPHLELKLEAGVGSVTIR